MKPKIFKPAFLLVALLALSTYTFAQDSLATRGEAKVLKSHKKAAYKHLKNADLKLDLDMQPLELAMDKLDIDLNSSLRDLNKTLNKSLSIIGPEISLSVNDVIKDIKITTDDNDNTGTKSWNGKSEEKVKNYSKSYPFDANDKLAISNKYGKVIVNTWNKNEVKVDVQIKGVASSDETAQKLVNAISISDSKDGNVVSFKTNFGSSNNNNGSIWTLFNDRNDHHKVEVNYTIYMPSKNALDIDNRYGATELPDFDGKVEINSAYGSFSAKALSSVGNVIKVRYGGAKIGSINSCDLEVGYGSLDLGSVDKLNGDFSYSSVKIGKVKTSVNIDARYAGGIDINELDKDFTSVSINASYSNIKVNLNNSANADFDVTTHYGGFDYGSLPLEITQKSPSDNERGFHPTKNYKGRIGKGDASRMITIKSTYSGLKFY
ncbi:MAG: hypothetical protein ABI203_05460 [Mucilaginibacter sp.]